MYSFEVDTFKLTTTHARQPSRLIHVVDEHPLFDGGPTPVPVELLLELCAEFIEQLFHFRFALRLRQVVGHVLGSLQSLQLHSAFLYDILDPELAGIGLQANCKSPDGLRSAAASAQ